MKTRLQMILLLVVATFVTNAWAQEVSIADPSLNGAIRDALRKPIGPLTEDDLLILSNLDASSRGVGSLEGLGAAHNLTTLNLSANRLTSVTLPSGLMSLTYLNLGNNQLTSLILPAGLTSLASLYLSGNPLTNFSFPSELTNLTTLYLSGNQLTTSSFPSGLTNLTTLYLFVDPQTRDPTLPAGLPSLTTLYVWGYGLTSLTLPSGLTNLATLNFEGEFDYPRTTFVLPEPLAATRLAGTVASLKSQGVSVYTYPLAVSLISPQRTLANGFGFTVSGPPGAYTILGSADLSPWSELGTLTNKLGTAVFTDAEANNSSQKFYRAHSQ